MPSGSVVRLPPYAVEATYTAASEQIDWSLRLYGIPEQWRRSEGEGVRVAVLDTGVEASHPDLRGAIEATKDFSRSRSGTDDRSGHGTHTAGTIGARRNETGVVGVAPRCRLLIGKVLGDDGSGTSEAVAEGVAWATEMGADVISLSLGSPQPSRALRAAIGGAIAAGRFVACAAGNEGRARSVNYPAKWPETAAIGAVDQEGRLARFSSRGPEVTVCAPGVNILSTYPKAGYARLSGTSMATPFVAGVAALAIAERRESGGGGISQRAFMELLAATAKDAGPPGRDDGFGAGLIAPERVLAGSDEEGEEEAGALRIGPISVNERRGWLVFEEEAA